MNEYSSRSHCIVSISLHGKNLETHQALKGKLCLIDLAGSERVSKSEAEGDRLKEACYINQSLTALGRFSMADSKLTHILKDALGQGSKTMVIVQASPSAYDLSETVSTLQFGTRIKNVETKSGRKSNDRKTRDKTPKRRSVSSSRVNSLSSSLLTALSDNGTPKADRSKSPVGRIGRRKL
eukprot:CAMPEP_0114998722 /NCGR_PEP_ID=MMETSP0216-20121206/15691_1 /TAXON_ID=223996 /ORGANISM="Protocruzia adherens, Strain Boccale" /LENGTH=180 /DNA_ID=CAMNT_0002363403 /DNA_START=121 /DNA_END=664 /DNA_ORIENTATION=+